MKVELKSVNIGAEIEKRLIKTQMTKTEFGRLIDVPQQHVNRIFKRDTIETKKLEKICYALDFNFFTLFCNIPNQIDAILSSIAFGDGDANNIIGDASIVAFLEKLKKVKEINEAKEETGIILRDQINDLKNSVEQYKASLKDKDTIISMHEKRIEELEKQLESYKKNE